MSTDDNDVDLITAVDLCRTAGISYRKLDYWTRARYVVSELAVTGSRGTPHMKPAQIASLPERWRTAAEPGSGTIRYYSPAEADIVKRIALLLSVGLALDCSARVARSWAEHPAWPVYLGHGVSLRLDDWHPEHPQQPDYVAAYEAAHTSPERH